jgi:secreted trypsin-like serine protease
MRLMILTLLLTTGCSTMQNLIADSQRVSRDIDHAKLMSSEGPGSSGIVNGRDVAPGSQDSRLATLLLITRGSSLHACTAVLIQKRVLLTAAHCVQDLEPKNVRVVFKTNGSPQEGPSDFKAEKLLIHEKYNGKPEGFSDLALVKIAADAPAAYEPVPLMTAKEKLTTDSVTLIGYGITSEEKKDSMILRETTKSFANDIHPKPGYFGIDQKTSGGGFCRGDSGAPIYAMVGGKRKLMGINSFTVGVEENKECHTASVAMPSSTFGDWIAKNAKKL